MSEIREKIMAIDWKSHANIGELTSGYRVIWLDGFKSATRAAADIAEAEVQRLEARVRELEEELILYKIDNRFGGTGS